MRTPASLPGHCPPIPGLFPISTPFTLLGLLSVKSVLKENKKQKERKQKENKHHHQQNPSVFSYILAEICITVLPLPQNVHILSLFSLCRIKDIRHLDGVGMTFT